MTDTNGTADPVITTNPPAAGTAADPLQVSRTRRRATWIALTAALGGLLYGYDTGVIAGALPLITQEWGLSHRLQETVASSILVGAVAGALLSGYASRALGRRRTIIVLAIIFALGVTFSAMAPNVWLLAAARVFLGIAVGGSSQVIPTFIAEIAPAAIRGRLVTCFNIAIGVGIFLANLIGATASHTQSWRGMVAIALIPTLVLFFGMLRVPETPRWLVEAGKKDKALDVLTALRPTQADALAERAEIEHVAEVGTSLSSGGWRRLGERWTWPALIAALGVAAFTQLSGLELMIYYTPTILQDTGFPVAASLWASVAVAAVYLIMTIIGRFIVDKVGRRGLMLVMIPGTAISLTAFATLFAVYDGHPPFGITVVLLLIFMAFNAGGIQVVGWLLGAEMYPLSIRDKATSLHAAVLWGANIFVTSQALTWVNGIGMSGTMYVYAALNVVGFLFVLFLVPETKGRSLEEIEESLKAGAFRPIRRTAQS